ncbi:hypothetical protein RC96_14875 [Pectobacterium carotovorum subsp. carotovorum]|nr:hypothetical protein RC96_14875 [Pectobacterium carotovorum subsp. carotovorum]
MLPVGEDKMTLTGQNTFCLPLVIHLGKSAQHMIAIKHFLKVLFHADKKQDLYDAMLFINII